MASKKKFDLENMSVQMQAVYELSPKLDMDSYLRAYTEFNNFFELMGTIFGFVASDVSSKIQILQEFRNGEFGNEFQTIEQMISYEKNGNMFEERQYVSGSRTLLRLHRALTQFLEEIIDLGMHEKLSTVCQRVYSETLGQYHPWLIRKAAIIAMYGLPSKHGLLQRIKGSNETEEDYIELLPKAVTAMKEVYYKTQKLYEVNNILDLP